MRKKHSVALRRRKLPSGKTSLYLDIYQGGVRTCEHLRLYLIPENNRKDREANRETLMLAEAIRAKRLIEVRNGEYGFYERQDESLLAYVQSIAITKRGSTVRRFNALLALLRQFNKRTSMLVSDITPAWYTAFLRFMERQGLARNTRAVYTATLRYCINRAVNDGLLASNPVAGIKGAGWEETNRTYLTLDEVRRLSATECVDEVAKRAFLFGCLTGLRHCDIERLTWGDVTMQGEYTRIIFRQAKTRGQEYLDITAQAVMLMGERGSAEDNVFPLRAGNTIRRAIFMWVAAAGITKHVTFHASRHTFAVMMLSLGTDIYTVSKLLGHRELSTTQVYARILDKAKREAVDKIPEIL